MEDQYIAINRALWNEKTNHHVASAFYDMEGFRQGKNTLNAPELELLGDVRGKRILHLQCHFGQDSISLARMGAEVVGVDFSDVAIAQAQQLAAELGANASFVCSDVYNMETVEPGGYDIVFASYGTIGWLPDVGRWARVVARHLKKGGRLVFAEFHPMVWMFSNDFEELQYSYFNVAPIIEELEGTYADRNAPMKAKEIGWNHPLTDVLQGLIAAGIYIERFGELDYSPYDCFANTVCVGEGMYMIKGYEGKLPMMYVVGGVRQ